MWCIRRLTPQNELLSEIISFSRRWVLILSFFYYFDIWFLTFGIIAQGLGVSLLHMRHLGIFFYNYFSTTFHKEHLGIYLSYSSRYFGLKFKLSRLYTFIDISYVRSGSRIILNLVILEVSL
jgi:hypothetical protein